jgi:formylglycine-generating enzyme required for sulfatase activity
VCQFWGADLPTVAEWEHAARKAGGIDERDYPWGNDLPTCATTWYGHHPVAVHAVWPGGGAGPVAVDGPEIANDVTPLGIIGMAGNVTELILDSGRPYDDACWHQQLLRNVGCAEVNAPIRYTKGGFFAEGTPALRAAQNDIGEPGIPQTGSGFRCVRR